MPTWTEVCARCGRTWSLADRRWRCQCGGLLDLAGPRVDPLATASTERSIWRYRSVLPVGDGWRKTTLGEGQSPLVPIGPGLWGKWEGDQPTGSFKARGASVMLALAADLGVETVVADSSGNAGAAVAAYARQAGMAAEIYVPQSTDPAKVAAIAGYGAAVVQVEGDREAAAAAARTRVSGGGAWYASHAFQPAFHHGVKTLAFELFEQLDGRALPTVVVPAGNGTLVLGLWLGFSELVAAGHLAAVPRLIAVQSERCAPLAGLAAGGPTAATGIAVARPPRLTQVRAAVVASGGRVLTAAEADLAPAQESLAGLGFPGVGLTSSAAWAAMVAGDGWKDDGRGDVVVILSGR